MKQCKSDIIANFCVIMGKLVLIEKLALKFSVNIKVPIFFKKCKRYQEIISEVPNQVYVY